MEPADRFPTPVLYGSPITPFPGTGLNYEYLWKELETLVMDLRSRGKEVPNEVVEDLKSARTLNSIQHVDPSSQASADVEDYLRRVETALINIAEYSEGKGYADEQLKRIQEAKARGLREAPKRQIGFVSGIPKGQDWVRVRVTELIDMKELDAMSRSLGLSNRKESEDVMIIHGSTEKLKVFMTQLTERVKRK
jgi:hypothetical protein